MAEKELLRMNHVSFGYANKQLLINDCTKKILSDRIYVLLGRNGIGKTTLLNLLVGNLEPISGAVSRSMGLDRIGYMSDEFFYYEQMNVLDMAEIIRALRNIKEETYKNRRAEYMRLLELEEYQHTDISKLSFGTKKRVHLLLTLLHDPQLLILDEPTNGLDPAQIVKFKKNINALKASGKTVIISTHSVKIAEDISDEILVLTEKGLSNIATDVDVEEAFLKLS